jgi:hypothetical protein
LGPYRFRPPEPNIVLSTEHEDCTQERRIQKEA